MNVRRHHARIMSLATLDKQKFLALLEDWHSHSVYYPDAVVARLAECGLAAAVTEDGKAVCIESEVVPATEPEWGDPGISPSSVLSTVYELTVGTSPESQMHGRGFWYRDVIDQLRKHWNIPTQ